MNLIQTIHRKIIGNAHRDDYPYLAYGLFQTISNPIYYFLWYYFDSDTYDSLAMRLVVTTLCFPLLFTKFVQKKYADFLPYYWHGTILLTLPFFFTFMLLKNNFSYEWSLNSLSGFVLCIIFMDAYSLLFLLPLGVILGVAGYHISTPEPFYPIDRIHSVFITYSSVIIFGKLFLIRNRLIQEVKQQSLKMQAGAIAHEMRTPLTAIESVASGLEHHLPTLVATQKRVQDQDPTTSPRVGRLALKALLDAPSDLQNITRSAANVISMLLMNLREDVPPTPPTVCSIAECVEGALRDYALNAQDRALITVHADADFKFLGSPLMIKHVFFNLLKNALHHVKELQKGGITIQTGINDGGQGTVVFEDTSKGIPADHLPHIFDQFFTRTAFGSGVGLAFCKMVMTKLGGDIACTSVYGEYTRFTLTFPLVHGETSPVSMG